MMEKVFKKLVLIVLLVFAMGVCFDANTISSAQAAQVEQAHGHGPAPLAPGEIPNHEKIRQADPVGIGLAITSMSVVFSSLLLLYLLFRGIGATMVWSEKKRAQHHALSHAKDDAKAADASDVFSGEIAAAISLAIQMYENDLHDKESTVLTINRVARAYSPWSSKIHGLRNMPIIKK